MQSKGYFAKVHYASKKEMVELTVDSMQYAHNESQRQVKVDDREKFDRKAVLAE